MEVFQAYLKKLRKVLLIVIAEMLDKLALTDHHVDMDMLLLVSVLAFLISWCCREH